MKSNLGTPRRVDAESVKKNEQDDGPRYFQQL